MEEQKAEEPDFIDSAHALVQALDAWAGCLGRVLNDRLPSRPALLGRLKHTEPTIDGPLLTQWLKGRNMLLEKRARGGRVPDAQDASNLAAVFLPPARQHGQQLLRLATEIQTHKRRLEQLVGREWRKAVIDALSAQPASARPAPGTSAQSSAETNEPAYSAVEGSTSTESEGGGQPAYASAPLSEAGPILDQDVLGPHAMPGSTAPGTGAEHKNRSFGEPPRDNVMEEAQPPAADGTEDQSPGPHPPSDLRRRPPRRLTTHVVLVGAAITVILAGTAAASWYGSGDKPRSTPQAAAPVPALPGGASPAPSAAAVATLHSEQPGLEKGTLGDDSRCSAPIQGPDAVQWRSCMRVEPTRVTFAIKITNLGQGPVSLKIRLQYTQGGGGPVFRDCPGAPSAYLLTVPAASTVITDQGQCAVPRADRSLAYSAAGWVLAADATDGSYRLSPAANVYADHTIWKPDLL